MDTTRPVAPAEATVLDVVGDGLVVWDAAGALISCNRRAEEILGVTADQLAHFSFDGLMHMVVRDLHPVADDGTPLTFEQLPALVALERDAAVSGTVIGIQRPDGSRFWIEIDVAPMHDRHGLAQLVSAFRDVTDRRELRATARFHERLLEAIGQPVTAVDPTYRIMFWNDAATELFGWTAEEAIGRPAREVIELVDDPTVRADNRANLLAGRSVVNELDLRHRDGHVLHVAVTRTPVFDDHGELIGIIGVTTDLTARAEAEAHNRALSAIVESSIDAIIGETLDGVVESWNAGAEALFGYSAEEIIGRDVSLLVPEGQRHVLHEVIASVQAGTPVENVEVERVRKDGEVVHVSLTASPVHDSEGRLTAISVIARDVSDLVAAREALPRRRPASARSCSARPTWRSSSTPTAGSPTRARRSPASATARRTSSARSAGTWSTPTTCPVARPS
jgi:PAS domain S-box-containing protein